jgi:hypothetical protein
MELIERINALEGEVKVIKGEIKSVLIDLRELMNNYENPFINVEQLSRVKEREKEKEEKREVIREDKGRKDKEQERTGGAEGRIEPESKPEIATPETAQKENREIQFTTKRDGEELKRVEKEISHKGGKIDIFTLTQLMKWADNSISNIGKDKLNELIDLYELTGRMPEGIKEIIPRIEDLSNANATTKDKIEMKDCVIAVFQLDRIVTGETGAQAPLLLSEDEISKWLKA